MKDYYEILGISHKASSEEIKKAFRINAIKYHPDKTEGNKYSTEKFLEVKEAYDFLGNSEKKVIYDLEYASFFFVETPKEKTYEKVYEEQKRNEQYRYDPYKPFYSTLDREIQDTLQVPPKQFPWGTMADGFDFKDEPIDQGFTFFKLPQRIGKLIGGFSNLAKSTVKKSDGQHFWDTIKSSYISLPLGAAYFIYVYSTGNYSPDREHLPILFFLIYAAIVIFVKFRFGYNSVKFSYINYYIGINGFAYYKCEGDTETLIADYEINFNEVTDLLSKMEVRKRNFQYVTTAYLFAWIDIKSGKRKFHISDTFNDEKGNPSKFLTPDYWLNREAEKYWTVYLLDKMEDELDSKGYLEFRLFNYETLVYTPYIHIGVGFITFLYDSESFTYRFDEIKRIYTKGTDLFIEHKNFQKKLFFIKSGNENSIPLMNLSNRQFFFKAMELLLGYSIN